MMKLVLLIIFCLIVSGETYSQAACSNIKIEGPAVAKPTEAGIVSSTCSTLLVKWKGTTDLTYIVAATYKDPATHLSVPTDAATDISCDNDQNCTATIPVTAGTKISWSVQAAGVIDGRTFYSYPVRVNQDYLVPDCAQPVVKVEETIAIEKKSDPISSAVTKEKLIVSNDKLAMYPNPVNNILNVKLNSDYKGNATITILDLSGQQMKYIEVNKQQAEYTDHITVSGLRPGMYYLNIKMKNGRSLTTRFIKN